MKQKARKIKFLNGIQGLLFEDEMNLTRSLPEKVVPKRVIRKRKLTDAQKKLIMEVYKRMGSHLTKKVVTSFVPGNYNRTAKEIFIKKVLPENTGSTGQQLAEAGMDQAIENAENKNSGWKEHAIEFLRKHAAANDSFTAEDIRLASEGIVPEPPDKRAWGSILVMGAKAGLIEPTGQYRTAIAAISHNNPKRVWKSLIIRAF